jgi:hypothetical protein
VESCSESGSWSSHAKAIVLREDPWLEKRGNFQGRANESWGLCCVSGPPRLLPPRKYVIAPGRHRGAAPDRTPCTLNITLAAPDPAAVPPGASSPPVPGPQPGVAGHLRDPPPPSPSPLAPLYSVGGFQPRQPQALSLTEAAPLSCLSLAYPSHLTPSLGGGSSCLQPPCRVHCRWAQSPPGVRRG